MKKKIWKILSYIIVATLASVVSVAICNLEPIYQMSKLDQLAALIESQFIGDADMKKAKDAAAAAMVYSLDDRWSYYLTAEEYVAHINHGYAFMRQIFRTCIEQNFSVCVYVNNLLRKLHCAFDICLTIGTGIVVYHFFEG